MEIFHIKIEYYKVVPKFDDLTKGQVMFDRKCQIFIFPVIYLHIYKKAETDWRYLFHSKTSYEKINFHLYMLIYNKQKN